MNPDDEDICPDTNCIMQDIERIETEINSTGTEDKKKRKESEPLGRENNNLLIITKNIVPANEQKSIVLISIVIATNTTVLSISRLVL
jgi:hypothetical protein